MTVIDPYFDGSMAHRSLDEASMEKKSQVDDGCRCVRVLHQRIMTVQRGGGGGWQRLTSAMVHRCVLRGRSK